MYKLKFSRREKKKLIRLKWVILGAALLAILFIVWFAWIRPMQKPTTFKSFEECAAAGNPIQESYPEVCLTQDGKRYVNTKQRAAHDASLAGEQELVPPSDPGLLKLEIDEWDVRVPLTVDTFDLIYSYIESGGEESVSFTYKRLVNLGVCQGDIGLTMTRSFVQNQPPFTESKPAPFAKVGREYFYLKRSAKPCYDPKNTEQMALVRKIAGTKTLTDATTSLLSKLVAAPEQ